MEGSLSINGLSQCVNHPPFEKGSHHQAQPAAGIADKISRRDPAHVGVGHQQHPVVLEAHHLRQDLSTGFSVVNLTDVAHRRPASRCLDRHAHNIFNFSGIADGLRLSDLLDLVFKHGICALSAVPAVSLR